MWLKRFILLAGGASIAVPMWLIAQSGMGTPTVSDTAAPSTNFIKTLAGLQANLAQVQQKNQLAEKNLQQIQAKWMKWKNQNAKLLTMLQTARTENLSLQNAVMKWQAAANQPHVHTVTGASGHGGHGDGGDGFGD
jgi:hypothetical protein